MTTRAAAAAVVIGVLGAPLAAAAGQPSAPAVRIDRCSLDTRTVNPDPFNSFPQTYVSGVTVRFTVAASAPVTDVEIAVSEGGTTVSLVERGPLEPGASVERHLPLGDGRPAAGNAPQCRVTGVRTAGSR